MVLVYLPTFTPSKNGPVMSVNIPAQWSVWGWKMISQVKVQDIQILAITCPTLAVCFVMRKGFLMISLRCRQMSNWFNLSFVHTYLYMNVSAQKQSSGPSMLTNWQCMYSIPIQSSIFWLIFMIIQWFLFLVDLYNLYIYSYIIYLYDYIYIYLYLHIWSILIYDPVVFYISCHVPAIQPRGPRGALPRGHQSWSQVRGGRGLSPGTWRQMGFEGWGNHEKMDGSIVVNHGFIVVNSG